MIWLSQRYATSLEPQCFARLKGEAEYRASQIVKGAGVVVRRGRKVPKGTEGQVFWLGPGAHGVRVRIRTLPDGSSGPRWATWTSTGMRFVG